MSAIAKSTPLTVGTTLLGQVIDATTIPPTVLVDGSDTATEAVPVGTYQPVNGDRIIMKKVGRQLAISGTFWDLTSLTAQSPSAWASGKYSGTIVLAANTWVEAGVDVVTGGQPGQITLVGTTLVVPQLGYYIFVVRVQLPNLAAATRFRCSAYIAGYGSGGPILDLQTDQTYPIMTPGPIVAMTPIPQGLGAGVAVSAYLWSSVAITIPANGLVIYGWRVS